MKVYIPNRDNILFAEQGFTAQAEGRGLSGTHYWHYHADLMYTSSILITGF